MADSIKASFDVPFENPLWTVPMAQQGMDLVQGIGTAAFQSKAIGMAVGLRLRDGIETQQVECLHGPVGHRGNPEAAPFAVALGDVHPAERLRSVTVPTQSAESGRLGSRCVPEDSVHTGSLRTRITDDSQDGQGPATERAREQINQSLDFIPSALRDGLHDTRLEPTNRTPDLLPVDGMPVRRTLGSRTSEHFCCRHICLSPRVGWPRFSRDGTPEGSQPAFAVRGCRPWADSPFIRSITERPSLPPSSLLRCLISVLYSPPSLAGRQRGYFVHLLDRSGVRSCLSAGGASSATGVIGAPVPDHVPFGSSLTASWACLWITALISTSPGLTCPGLLAPDRRDAGSRRVGSRVHGRSGGPGYVGPQASDAG